MASGRASITAATLTEATQTTAPTGTLSLSQSGTGANTQAANRADGGSNAIGTLRQTTTNTVAGTMNQDGGTGKKTQALNMANGAGVTTSTTQTTTGELAMNQGSTTAVADDSQQAANLLKSTGTGNVELATQTLGAVGAAKDFTLAQVKTGTAGTVQAGNLIDMSEATGAGALTASDQKVITTGTLILAQNASTVTNGIQAGNAILTGANTGGSATQAVTATNLVMTQGSAIDSFQAANYLGDKL